MNIPEIKKPIISERTWLSEKLEEVMSEIDLPIYNWCRQQDLKRKNIKL